MFGKKWKGDLDGDPVGVGEGDVIGEAGEGVLADDDCMELDVLGDAFGEA